MKIMAKYIENFTREEIRTERWKDIEGYDNLYRISSLGRIMSDHGNGYRRMKPNANNHGQVFIMLSEKGEMPRSEMLCMLVARAFVDNPNNYKHIRFKDGNPLNCRADNLEWIRLTENQENQYAQRRRLVNQYSLDGEYLRTFESSNMAASEYGTTDSAISNACNKHKVTKNFQWRYADEADGTNPIEPAPKKLRPIQQISIETGEVIADFENATAATAAIGGNATSANIVNCCMGKRKTAYGFKWKYIEL